MTLEIVVQSPDDAVAAARSGADRLEMVSALTLGGLTPSFGAVEESIAACDLPVMAMLRPRSGGFGYSGRELSAMERDGARFLAAGARGLVFGVLDENGIDAKANARLLRLGGEAVFHRAFDALPDAFEAIERLVDLGFRRILTSGGPGTALQGVDRIRSYVERSAGRIEILPGGGIRPENAHEIMRRTGATQLHLGAVEWSEDRALAAPMAFNTPHPEGRYGRVDPHIVQAVRSAAREGGSPSGEGGGPGSPKLS